MDDYKEKYEEWERNYGKECKKRLESDPKFPLSVTPQQAMLIEEPNDAPENFYCDGEITPEEALSNWKEKLKYAGFNPMYVKIITKYVFE